LTAGRNAKLGASETWGNSFIFLCYLGYTNMVSVDNKSGLASTIYIIHLQFNYSNNYYYYYYYYYYYHHHHHHRISHFSALAGKYSPILGRSNQQD